MAKTSISRRGFVKLSAFAGAAVAMASATTQNLMQVKPAMAATTGETQKLCILIEAVATAGI